MLHQSQISTCFNQFILPTICKKTLILTIRKMLNVDSDSWQPHQSMWYMQVSGYMYNLLLISTLTNIQYQIL